VAETSDKDAPPSGEIGVRLPILLVGNPASRGGAAADRFDEARRAMEARGLEHELRATLPDGGTVEMVSRAIREDGYRTVVCLGGDGTFNEVAKGICLSGMASEVTMGMLPSGTANDQGKSFGLSSSARALDENAAVIARGHTTRLDVGEVEALTDNGTVIRRDLFFDSMGWGLSAAILSFRNRELENVRKLPVVRDMYRDQMVYVRAAVHELALSWVTRDRFTAEISLDGEPIVLDRLSDMVISNTKLYAGEWIVDEESAHDDGLLEVAPFRGVRDWTSKLIVLHKKVPLTEDMLNRIGVSHAPIYRASSIQVQIFRPSSDKRLPAQLDGEEFPQADHFRVAVRPRMITLVVPEGFHWV